MLNTSKNRPTTETGFSFSTPKETQTSKIGYTASPCSSNVSRIGPSFVAAVPGSTFPFGNSNNSKTRKQENRFQTTNPRNQRKATARAYKRREAAEEKCSSSGSHHGSSSDCSTRILEDPYVEKARMQEKFARENPEEKLSKILEENSSKILAGNSPKIPAGNSSTILEERRRRCRSGEMPKILAGNSSKILAGNSSKIPAGKSRDNATIQIGVVDSPVESEHWTLTPASKRKKAKVQPAVSGRDSDEIRIQALTDASFKKVCGFWGRGECMPG